MAAPSPASRWRDAWIGSVLVTTGLLACLLIAEVGVRALGTDDKRWQFRNFLDDPGITGGRWRILQPDPMLGYVPRPGYSGTDRSGRALLSFDERGLRLHGPVTRAPVGTAPPVLVVGDSYAMGEEVGDDETFPAYLQEILGRHVLNGGVQGYGIDQIVLRAERLVPALRPDTLVVSFIADDVRRATLRILWGIDKPYFDIVGGRLSLRNVPVPPPTASSRPLGPVRSILGYSFLADVAARRLNLESWWLEGRPMHAVVAHDRGARVSCLLMDRLRLLSEAYALRVLVVGEYTPDAWQSPSGQQFEARVIDNLLACAEKSGLDTLDTLHPVEAAVTTRGPAAYYVNWQKNAKGNHLVASLIANALQGGPAVGATR
jgi:hypothetical protein